MQQYNIFQAIYLSFYSKQLYRDVAKNWGGKSFLYLLLIVALSWIAFTYFSQIALNASYREHSDVMVSQIPIVTIKDGRVITPEKRPYIIEDSKTHERLVVIDTTGQYTTLEKANALFLITENKVFVQKEKSGEVIKEANIYEIPKTMTTTLNPRQINGYLEQMAYFIWIPLYICVLLVGFCYRLMQALIYGVIGKIIAGMSRVTLTYSQVVQIAMVAITPALVLATIFDVFQVFFAHQLLFYFLLTMFYLFYGIIVNKTVTSL